MLFKNAKFPLELLPFYKGQTAANFEVMHNTMHKEEVWEK
jgi:hypothetical protein